MSHKIETRSKAATNTDTPKVNNPKEGPSADKYMKLIKNLDDNISNRFKSLEATLNTFMSDVKDQIAAFKSHLVGIEDHFNAKLKECQQNFEGKITALEDKMETLERRSIASDIILTGVPSVRGENTCDVICTITEALGLPGVKPINAYRVPSKQKSSSMVIAKLASVREKKQVLRGYYSRLKTDCPLTLRNIGFDSNAKVYINECLTSRMYRIRRYAERLKRNGDIAAVFTLNGLVYIRATADDEPVQATSIEFLEMKLQRRRSV